MTEHDTTVETADTKTLERKPIITTGPGPLKFGQVPVPDDAESLINPPGGSPSGTYPFDRFTQPSKESQEAMTADDYRRLIGEGILYEGVPALDPVDMFKNPLWHVYVADE